MVKLLNPWVEPSKNGKFRYRAKFKNPLTLKYQTVNVTIPKNTPQARRKGLAELQKKADKKAQENKYSKITLGALRDKYLKWLDGRQVPYNTYQRNKFQTGLFINDLGEDVIASKITTIMLNRYFNEMLNKKTPKKSKKKFYYSNESIIGRRACIKNMYQFGVNFGFVKENPVLQVAVSTRNENYKKANRLKYKFLTNEEYHILIKACEKKKRYDLRDLIIWLYNTGMRINEAVALRPSDVYQDKNDGYWYCKVTGSLIRKKNVPLNKRFEKSDSAKTFAGNRDVLLSKGLVRIYKRHKDNLCDYPVSGSRAILFLNEFGDTKTTIDASTFDQFLQRCEEKYHIKKHLTSHIFRHSHISNLLSEDVDLKTVMVRVGHVDASMILDIYAHVTKEQRDNLAKVIGA